MNDYDRLYNTELNCLFTYIPLERCNCSTCKYIRGAGVEPASLAAPDPKSGTFSATVGRKSGRGATSRQQTPPSATPTTTRSTTRAQFRERKAMWLQVVASFGGCCAYCGEKADPLVREHMVPLLRGGDDSIENIVPACGRCNNHKRRRTPLEWFLMRGEAPSDARTPAVTRDTPCTRCGSSSFKSYPIKGRGLGRHTRCVVCFALAVSDSGDTA